MIHTLGTDFKILLGRIGSWPGDFGPDVAVQLYNVAAKNLPANGTAVDLTPSAGKSTIVLSAAAFRNNAKVVCLIDKAVIHPMEELWFNRAYRLFKLKDACVAAEKIQNMDADMIVVRGNEQMARAVYSEGLKQDGVLFGINMAKLDGVEPEQSGLGWACWRKPKAPFSMKGIPNTEPPPKGAPIVLGERLPENVIADAIVISEDEVAAMRKRSKEAASRD